jgi:hypothetical protein
MRAADLQCTSAVRYGSRMRPVPRWFVALCWALAVLFSLCVGLQVNDPDPIRWMLIYGGAAIAVALLPAQSKVWCIGGTVVGIVAAAWGAYLGSQVASKIGISDLFLKMSEKGGAVEVGREAGGLVIIAVSLLVLSLHRYMRD